MAQKKGEMLGNLANSLIKNQSDIAKEIKKTEATIQSAKNDIAEIEKTLSDIELDSIKNKKAQEKINKEMQKQLNMLKAGNSSSGRNRSSKKTHRESYDTSHLEKADIRNWQPLINKPMSAEQIKNITSFRPSDFNKIKELKESGELKESTKELKESGELKESTKELKESGESTDGLAKEFDELKDTINQVKDRMTELFMFEWLRKLGNFYLQKNKEDNERLNQGISAGLSVEGVRKAEAVASSLGFEKDHFIQVFQELFKDKANIRHDPNMMNDAKKAFFFSNIRGGLGLGINDLLGKNNVEAMELIMTKLQDAIQNPSKYGAVNPDEVIQGAVNAGYGNLAQMLAKGALSNQDVSEIFRNSQKYIETPKDYLKNQSEFNKEITEFLSRIENILQDVANSIFKIVAPILKIINSILPDTTREKIEKLDSALAKGGEKGTREIHDIGVKDIPLFTKDFDYSSKSIKSDDYKKIGKSIGLNQDQMYKLASIMGLYNIANSKSQNVELRESALTKAVSQIKNLNDDERLALGAMLSNKTYKELDSNLVIGKSTALNNEYLSEKDKEKQKKIKDSFSLNENILANITETILRDINITSNKGAIDYTNRNYNNPSQYTEPQIKILIDNKIPQARIDTYSTSGNVTTMTTGGR